MITYTGFYWDPLTEKTAIPLSWPRGISDPGLVAGVSAIYDINAAASSTMPYLPATYPPLALLGINSDGIAVGYVQICNCSNSQGMLQKPYVWDPAVGAHSLPVPGATGASRINGQRRIVGWIGGNSMPDGYMYDLTTGSYTIMSTLFPGANTKTTADDISDNGVVVGSRMSSNGQTTHGYTWTPGSGVQLLPLPPAGFQPYVRPSGINNGGVIVGSIYDPLGSSRAFVYDAAHGIRDLNTLTTPSPGFTMLAATAVNNNGWIVGYGAGGGGMYKSFVLQPVAAAPPAEVDAGVRLRRNGLGAEISWHLAAGATASSILRGDVSALPVGPGGADETCLVDSVPANTLTWPDNENPEPGAGFWYLVRGENAYGHGPYGFEAYDGIPTVPRVSATCP